MSKKRKVNWSDIDGASPKPKRLHLEKDETDSLFHCPKQERAHAGFQSQRGRRKHVNTKHSWFFYFDEKPNSKEIDFAMENTIQDQTSETTKHAVLLLPSFSSSCDIGGMFRNVTCYSFYRRPWKQTLRKSTLAKLQKTIHFFRYLYLVYTTQVNSTFRARWLASSEVISQVLFTSEQPKKNRKAFVAIFSQIKLLFGSLVIQLVWWYILKQLFTSVSVKVVDINLAASRLGKYPPLFTSTSVNNCSIFTNLYSVNVTATPPHQTCR